MLVLGIESSCDETGVALYDSEKGLVAHQIYSQIKLHAQYGGVVPELASRDHIRKLPFLVNAALEESSCSYHDIEGVAYTEGPGLIGALMVGAMYAQGLSYALNCPLLGIHHMEAHLLAVMLEENKPEFPFIALLVSGGHTQLIHVRDFGVYEILGDTLDDAVGEAFDKTAKLMGMPYPGGPYLAKMAEEGDALRFSFPRPMLDRPGLDFSFSGLKTKALLTINTHQVSDYPDIAASFQSAIVETLVKKCLRAVKEVGCQSLVVAGGVGANKSLREALNVAFHHQNVTVFYPRQVFCTDNGAMVAYLGHERLMKKEVTEQIQLKARWPLSDLNKEKEA